MANNDDAVRKVSSNTANAGIDEKMRDNLGNYKAAEFEEVEERIQELDKEWDIERSLQLNAAVLGITGTVLGLLVNKRWLALPILVTAFLAQHSVQGWCPPIPILRRFGFRTRKEIDREKFALKALRGDFRRTVNSPNKAWNAVQS